MKNFIKENWFKILGIVILFFALGSHPYGYYQFLRWAIMIIGVYSAYSAYEHKNITWVWIFGLMAVLFNPIIPIYLEKEMWVIIDLIAGIFFVLSMFLIRVKNK